ncbi:Clc protein-like family-containing protein [Aphelenchoides besseyi]|nr:Clc protein-like family-containing protein [Aphelenchoides besseyi]
MEQWSVVDKPTKIGPLDLSTRLAKLQFTTFVLIFISNTFAFLATLTPSWQATTDLDANREVQSGLWIYCPGQGVNCWYIFSDSLINYYEKVDVCRFFLIGDCRKKLLRTPYFFGWHYAVLICMFIAMTLAVISMAALIVAYFRPRFRKSATVVMDSTLALSFLTLCIALSVFMINAEMLESRFLIGVKNTFPKSYGYSFYLAGIAMTVMLFAMLAAVVCSTNTFFMNQADAGAFPNDHFVTQDYVFDARGLPSYNMSKQTAYNIPSAQYSPSDTSTLQTRTFISY